MKEETLHSIEYLSANCNRKPHGFDIKGDLVIYPSHHSICVYNLIEHRHRQLLNGHSKPVNCVRWIKSVDSFVSSSLDGCAFIWVGTDGRYEPKLCCKGTADALVAIDSVVITSSGENKYLTCASTCDEKVYIWLNDELVSTYDAKQFVFDIRLVSSDDHMIGDEVVLIGLVGSDCLVHLMAFDNQRQLHSLMKLSGHEDWIQSLDFILDNQQTLYLASGSQDMFIRMWKISRIQSEHSERGRVFNWNGQFFEVEIETVAAGHEGWIYSVQFVKNSDGQVCLLSASMDKSIVLWSQVAGDEFWSESIRVGDVGGCALGFVGALTNPDLNQIIAQSFNGDLHIWTNDKELDTWSPEVGLGGHWEQINDLSWEPHGHFLLSCSLDQTTRLHAPWKTKGSGEVTWHEVARPQIHGYDLNCLAVIDGITFASGADEKVVRIFGGTKSFLQSFLNIADCDLSKKLRVERDLPECASVPPLGLSNKAIYSEVDMDEYFKSVILSKPPLAEILQQNTLWPEIQKLYGHLYETFTIACNHTGTFLASACKSSKVDSANIIVWDIVNNFKKIQELPFHSLTITRIKFSPNDQYLISVSRDRTWCIYKMSIVDSQTTFVKIANSDKKTCSHSRIIWDVAWTADNQYFVTCSRDKKAIVWHLDENSITDPNNQSDLGSVSKISDLLLADSVTAVDISSHHDERGFIVAFGLELGHILIYRWSPTSGWTIKLTIDNCHTAQIKRLRFRPGSQPTDHLLLASGADDRKVIIHRITL